MARLQRTVVITGCDVPSSYAYELALRLDEQGYSVFAGCTDCNSVGARSLASRGTSALAILQIDVTKPDEIKDAAEMIEDAVGDEGVWALVNCAEVYTVAEVDWCPMEDYKKSVQVNLLGPISVTRALLHLIRRARGRVVNLSSIAGCLARAGQSAYSATKFALEAFSDCLRQEMLKWGVYVILVQPAYFPVGQAILCESNLNVGISMVPKRLRDVYGDDYFVEFVNSVTDSANSQSQSEAGTSQFSPSRGGAAGDALNQSPQGSPHSTATSGYSSASSTLKSSLDGESSQVTKKGDTAKDTQSLNLSSTLKSRSTPNLQNTNRVLHALVEAVTASSPKVRYFVGSFQDKMIKSLAPVLPTVVMDTYLTSGQISKVIPKLIKEKME